MILSSKSPIEFLYIIKFRWYAKVYDYAWDAALMEPGKVWWQVSDNNWKEDVSRFHTTICSRIVPDPGAPPRGGLQLQENEINKLVKMGLVKKPILLKVWPSR